MYLVRFTKVDEHNVGANFDNCSNIESKSGPQLFCSAKKRAGRDDIGSSALRKGVDGVCRTYCWPTTSQS